MVEEDKERPVDEPGALLQRLQRRAEGALVDELLQPVEILQGGVPVLHEDLGGQLAPHPVQVVGIRRLDEDAVEVEILAGPRVVAALVLHLGKVVAGVDHLRLEAVVLDEELQQLLGVARLLNLLRHLGILKDLEDGLGLRLEAFEILDDLGSLVPQGGWHLLVRVQGLVDVHGKVHHAGVGEEVQLAAEQVRLVVVLLHGEKLEEGEH